MRGTGLLFWETERDGSETEKMEDMTETYDSLAERLLGDPCWIADILPERVPAEAGGRYFEVEKYYRRKDRIRELHREQAEILLRLNCYDAMAAEFGFSGNWEQDPDPEKFVCNAAELPPEGYLRVMFPERMTKIEIDPEDTWMTVYCRDPEMLERVRAITEAEGLFLRKGDAAI